MVPSSRNDRLVSFDSWGRNLSLNELHRRFHLYLSFRGKKGDAIGVAPSNRRLRRGAFALGFFRVFSFRSVKDGSTRLSQECGHP